VKRKGSSREAHLARNSISELAESGVGVSQCRLPVDVPPGMFVVVQATKTGKQAIQQSLCFAKKGASLEKCATRLLVA